MAGGQKNGHATSTPDPKLESVSPSCVFLFTGEGAHAAQTDVPSLMLSPLWDASESALQSTSIAQNLETFLRTMLGVHAAPTSPIVTTLINILNARRWQGSGHEPALGHSIGEVAAAYAAGLLTVEGTLKTASILGQVGVKCEGAMVHTHLTRQALNSWPDQEKLCVAAVNGVAGSDLLSVTLCGSTDGVQWWMAVDSNATSLKPPHAWHHPVYGAAAALQCGNALNELPACQPGAIEAVRFISATKRQQVTSLGAAYWQEWLTSPVQFEGALECAASHLGASKICYIIETGPHPILTQVAVQTLAALQVCVVGHAASMRRGQPAGFWEAQCSSLEALLKSSAPRDASIVGKAQSRPENLAATISMIREVLGATCQLDVKVADLGSDSPLMRAGLDSVDLPGFVDALNAKFQVKLPPTLVLECGTIREIASRLMEDAQAESSLSASISGRRSQQLASRQALVGAQARLPGAIASVGRPFQQLLTAGGDAVGCIPTRRWEVVGSAPSAGRYGGFLIGAQVFDAGFFGISSAEAKATDPQQRLLLEDGYAALHAVGERIGSLTGADVGVFLGIMNADFASKNVGNTSVYAATGGAISIASGRLPFALGLQGPCVSYDTACSSGLIAVHAGSSALGLGECPIALTCAVSLMLSPTTHALYARAGMLSSDGRCKTFDARANGYARGEGVGVVLLSPAPPGTMAQQVLGSSTIRSDGKSASLTAPNGTAQARLLKATAAASAITSVGLVQAHGTGTPLGDPTEINALARAFKGSAPCIGSLKASMGHLEPTAGLAGLLCLMEVVGQEGGAPNAKLRALNPLLKSAVSVDVKARVPAQQLSVHEAAASSGVSSFGYSGTIAHAVVLTTSDNLSPADVRVIEPIARSKSRIVAEATKSQSALQTTAPAMPKVDQTPQAGHWLYEIAWAVVSPQIDGDEGGGTQSEQLKLLVVTQASLTSVIDSYLSLLPSHVVHPVSEVTDSVFKNVPSCDGVLLFSGNDELLVMRNMVSLLKAQATLQTKAPPLLCCTAGTQCVDRSPTGSFINGSLWGLARSVRPEHPVSCIDVQLQHPGQAKTETPETPHAAFVSWARCQMFKIPNGYVRGLNEQETNEVEAAIRAAHTFIPRLVCRFDQRPMGGLPIELADFKMALDKSVSDREAKLDMPALNQAHALLEVLCQQYMRDAVTDLTIDDVPQWFHKCVYKWCIDEGKAFKYHDVDVTTDDVLAMSQALYPEHDLAKAIGPLLRKALTSEVRYQELLFPGGSFELVFPWYNEAVLCDFNNETIVSAVKYINQKSEQHQTNVTVLEIGAGTGGTASQTLPLINGHCEKYIFTDVSEQFLRQARKKFSTDYPFVEYTLCNIDADPRLQGFALHQVDVIIATNVLHATPFIKNTLTNCRKLLKSGGLIFANESLHTTAFLNITFGLTDGWWLFHEVGDPVRVGQICPHMNGEVWTELLKEAGFEDVHVAHGNGFLTEQGIIVAQVKRDTEARDFTSSISKGAHAFCGALGGLGFLTAKLLDEHAAPLLVIASQNGRLPSNQLTMWESLKTELKCVSYSSKDDLVETVLAAAGASKLSLTGVYCSALGPESPLSIKHSVDTMLAAYKDAVEPSAGALMVASTSTPLTFFGMYASNACLLGSSIVSAALATQQTAMAEWRRGSGLVGTLISCGNLMTDFDSVSVNVARAGLSSASHKDACSAMIRALFPHSSFLLPVDWTEYFYTHEPTGLLAGFGYLKRRNANEEGGGERNSLKAMLNQVLGLVESTAALAVDADAPLQDAGLDSLGAIELTNQLQEVAGSSMTLPSTLVFTYPTARQLATYLAGSDSDKPEIVIDPVICNNDSIAVKVAGQAVLIPGHASNCDVAWWQAAAAVDAIEPVPSGRWNDDCVPANAAPVVVNRMKFAGWYEDERITLFDNPFFAISPSETSMMDPQQRLLLEHGYEAFHHGGLLRSDLHGALAGVYIGIAYTEFRELMPASAIGSSFGMTGVGQPAASGRISYSLGLQGPCMSIDTACSATLVAADGARRTVASASSTSSLAAGVNMMLTPGLTIILASGAFTSERGRCHTFDHRADGYCRGEGCVAVSLRGVEKGEMAVSGSLSMPGSGVRQDGRSASLTAPNAQAQTGLLANTYVQSAVDLTRPTFIEGHGTGTALGDPIEVGALSNATQALRGDGASVVMSSVKANLGHTEPAAGATGLLRLILQAVQGAVAPNAQLCVLNNKVRDVLGSTAFTLPLEITPLKADPISGVSSFGYSGTIAHTVIAIQNTGVQEVTNDDEYKAPKFMRAAFTWDSPYVANESGKADGHCLYTTGWTFITGQLSVPGKANPESAALVVGPEQKASSPGLVPMSDPPDTVVIIAGASTSKAPGLHCSDLVLQIAKWLAGRPTQMVLLASNAMPPLGAAANVLASSHGGAVGLMSVFRHEQPKYKPVIVDFSGSHVYEAPLIARHAWRGITEHEAMIHEGRPMGMRLRQSLPIQTTASFAQQAMEKLTGSSYMITGGLGGLGLIACKMLVEAEASTIVLCSRRGNVVRGGQGLETQLTGLLAVKDTNVSVAVGDISCPNETAALCMALEGTGVLHAAGLADRGLAAELTHDQMAELFVSKAKGAWHLHSTLADSMLRAFIFFSSTAPLYGNTGQSNYASSNAALHAFAISRIARGQAARVLMFPLVSGQQGMGAAFYTATQQQFKGMSPISVDQYLACVSMALTNMSLPICAPLARNTTKLLDNVPDESEPLYSMLAQYKDKDQKMSISVPSKQAAKESDSTFADKLAKMEKKEQDAFISSLLTKAINDVSGTTIKSADVPLIEAGLDSLAAGELSNQLRSITGQALSPTLVFDHPNMRAIAAHLTSALVKTKHSVVATPKSDASGDSAQMSLSSIAGRWPGMSGSLSGQEKLHLETFAVMEAAGNAVGNVPALRWTPEHVKPLASSTEALQSATHGGFLMGADRFDGNLCLISSGEAGAMDPQQRLLLEFGYTAVHHSGHQRISLLGSLIGVHVGIQRPDWMPSMQLKPSKVGTPWDLTGAMSNIAAGRISFILGLQGPCISMDTACSSGLVAIHVSTAAVRASECVEGLACSVSLLLTPDLTVAASIAGMLSADGRCKTYDKSANGYVRSEGSSAGMVKPGLYSGFQLPGSTVGQDGKSASLTAPNSLAQRYIIQASLARSSCGAILTAVESHGTGTRLGDPMETSALASVDFGDSLAFGDSTLPIGAGKANIGHGEAASGAFGIFNMALHLQAAMTVAPNAKLSVANPFVNEAIDNSVLALPQQPTLNPIMDITMATVSSFGYSGTIANGLLARLPGPLKMSHYVNRILFRRGPCGWALRLPSSTVAQTEKAEESTEQWLYELDWAVAAAPWSSEVVDTVASKNVLALMCGTEDITTEMEDALSAFTLQKARVTATSPITKSTFDAVIVYAADEATRSEDSTMETALRLFDAQAQFSVQAESVWFITRGTQNIDNSMVTSYTRAGLWGLARSLRQDQKSTFVSCVDIGSRQAIANGDCPEPKDGKTQCQMLVGLAKMIEHDVLRLPGGIVRGLQESESIEPESALRFKNLCVPRLCKRFDSASASALLVPLDQFGEYLGASVKDRMQSMDMDALNTGHVVLERLCQQYIRDAIADLKREDCPKWHHQDLYDWCKAQPTLAGPDVTVDELRATHTAMRHEAKLAEHAGQGLRQALTSEMPYQELLFPGGSFELLLPVYEEAEFSGFSNQSVNATIKYIASTSKEQGRMVSILEVGAGTGGTASKALPLINGHCSKYIFTDVSEQFLRQARKRFSDFPFIEYQLCNIDADPRLQGFALHQCDVIIATNVLHATPFMANTLRNCGLLLKRGGLAIINEGLRTSAFFQITFGLTDGWWLFKQVDDPVRIGYGSPLMAGDTWRKLLAEAGFENTHIYSGDGFLADGSVIVAQVARGSDEDFDISASVSKGGHLIAGSLGGLGFLTGKLLDERGAPLLVLASQDGRIPSSQVTMWESLKTEVKCVDSAHMDEGNGNAVSAMGLVGVFYNSSPLPSLSLGKTVTQRIQEYNLMLKPTLNAQAIAATTPLNFFGIYTSTAGILGTSAAESTLAALASTQTAMIDWRRGRGLVGSSVMALSSIDTSTTATSSPIMGIASYDVAIAILSSWFNACNSTTAVCFPDLLTSDKGALSKAAQILTHRSLPAQTAPTEAAPKEEKKAAAPKIANFGDAVLTAARELVPSDLTVDLDTTLMDVGLDSLAAAAFIGTMHALIHIQLPPDILTNYETPRELAEYLDQRHGALDDGSADDINDASPEKPKLWQFDAATTTIAMGTAKSQPRLPGTFCVTLSSPRSGSSLFQLCLAAHPQIFAPQEIYLLPFDSMSERRDFIKIFPLVEEGLVQAVMQMQGTDIIAAKKWIEACPDTATAYKDLQDRCAPKILADKTPMNADHRNYIRRCFKLWEAPKLIWLIRHPLATLPSFVELLRTRETITMGFCNRSEASLLDESEAGWALANQEVGAVWNELPMEAKCGPILYEDVVIETAKEMRKVTSMLGLDYFEGMANPYETEAVKSFEAAEATIVADYKLMKNKSIDPKQAEKWRRVAFPRPLHRNTAMLAKELGYEMIPDLVVLNEGTDSKKTPMVAVHGYDGKANSFQGLANKLKCKVLALEDPAFTSEGEIIVDDPAWKDWTVLAARLACRVTAFFGKGREFDMMGSCWGAVNARLTADAVLKLGGKPRNLVLIDPPPPPQAWVANNPQLALQTVLRNMILPFLDPREFAPWRGTLPDGSNTECVFPEDLPDLLSFSEIEAVTTATTYMAEKHGWNTEQQVDLSRRLHVAMKLRKPTGAHQTQSFEPSPRPHPTVVVKSSRRAAFFDGIPKRGEPGERGLSVALVHCNTGEDDPYGLAGEVTHDLVVEGNHATCVRVCSAGLDANFVKVLNDWS